ncbi:MAG: efflux RND transporter periplasmic adaptor subunit [Planctomycetota bacterium]|jgi:HlyD family secretion protein
MRTSLKKLGWPVGIAIVLAALYLWAARRPMAVEMAEVVRGAIEEYVTEEARTQLHTKRTVTAELPGTARRIALEVGDRVEKGQVVTTIEDTELKLSLDVMRASVKEIEGRLAGVDVPLPKKAEIEAAEGERQRAIQQVNALKEERRAAEADLRYAQSDLRRIEELFQSGSTTDRQYELAQRDLENARARLEALNRRLAAAETAVTIAELRKQVLLESMQDTAHLRQVYGAQIDRTRKTMDLIAHEMAKTRVTSPIAGVVLAKHVDSEQYVQPGTPLIEVGVMASIEIRADILSDEVRLVREGQEALLVGRAIPNPEARGRVKKIYPSGFTKISSLGVRQQRVPVLVDFDNSSLDLGPGYELDVKIVVRSADEAVLVPNAAVFATAQGAAVFAVRKGKARVQPIETGLKGEQFYQVVEGLAPGDIVILRPPTDVQEGQRVRARRD